MTYSSPLKAAAAALALGLAATTGAQAQETYSDAKLEAFVTAALQVSDMRDELQAELEAAETEEARQQVVADANADIQSLIESSEGITVEEYTEIGQALGSNEELDARVGALVDEKTGGASQ